MMRAVARAAAGLESPRLDPRPEAELPTDEVVVVLLTRDTWERARALGRAYGHGPDALVGLALRALQERAEAAGLVPKG
jgi:hypothetical protein